MSHKEPGSSPDNKVATLLARLHRVGIEIDEAGVKDVLDFFEKYSDHLEVSEAKEAFYSDLTHFMESATTNESKLKVVRSWNRIVELYNAPAGEPESVTEEHHIEQPTKRNFPWAWVIILVFMTILSFTLGSKVFPDVKAANTRATAELQKKIVDQANQFARDRNAFDVACLEKQKHVAAMTADACSKAWNDRLSGKK